MCRETLKVIVERMMERVLNLMKRLVEFGPSADGWTLVSQPSTESSFFTSFSMIL